MELIPKNYSKKYNACNEIHVNGEIRKRKLVNSNIFKGYEYTKYVALNLIKIKTFRYLK